MLVDAAAAVVADDSDGAENEHVAADDWNIAAVVGMFPVEESSG